MLLTPYFLLLFPFTTAPCIFALITAVIFIAVAILLRRILWSALSANQDPALLLTAKKIDRWLVSSIIIYCLLDLTQAYPALNTPLFILPLKIAFAALTLLTIAGLIPTLLRSQQFSPPFPDASIQIFTRCARTILAIFAILLAWDAIPFPILPIFLQSNFALAASAITLYAARTTLSDIAAGITLHCSRRMPNGTCIRFKNMEATIENMGLRTTEMQISNGEKLIVANSQLLGEIIVLPRLN